MSDERDTASRLVSLLREIRAALSEVALPLDVPGVVAQRSTRDEMSGQLDDYVLPRLERIEAPLLTVVGGSTGAGKSTLVNSLVGRTVSEPGVLRPTTRSPVLVHHPSDREWFEDSRILPDLVRAQAPSTDPRSLQLVAADTVPAGLAILDAPDIDSVESRNRALATQLLAAADLWLFTTSAARYADQVPWDFLKAAAERSTAVAIVLDRVPPDAEREVRDHLAEMLRERGLGASHLFSVAESDVDEQGLLLAAEVEDISRWLGGLAADSTARAAVVRQTLHGAVRSVARRTAEVAAAHRAQLDARDRLRLDIERAYGDAVGRVDEASADGSLLRGEVLARWQEFVGTGELLRSLESGVGRVRDRVAGWFRGQPRQVEHVTVAVESGLESLLVENAEAAAERARASWRASDAGAQLLQHSDADLGRASRDFRTSAERSIRDWQQGVLDLVRSEGADRRSTARFLAFGVNGLSVALMIVVFAHTAGVTGAEAGIAGGSAVLGQKLLEAVFGDQAVRRLADHARLDLERRVTELYEQESARYLDALDRLSLTPEPADRLSRAAEQVERLMAAGGDDLAVEGAPR